MDESIFEGQNLKNWREERNYSQKKLSDLCGISLTTLRQLETGGNKPQKRTVKKVLEALNAIASAAPDAVVVPKPRRRRRMSKSAPTAVVKPKATDAPPAAPTAAPTAAPAAPAAPVKAPKGAGPIHLSNLDLELMTRILNMTDLEKVELLKRFL